MKFSRQEYWSGLSFPSLGDLPDPGVEPWSPTLQADSLPTDLLGKPSSKAVNIINLEMSVLVNSNLLMFNYLLFHRKKYSCTS